MPRWMRRDLAGFGAAAILAALAFIFGEAPPEGGIFAAIAAAAGVAGVAGAASWTERTALFAGLIGAAYLVSGWNVLSGAWRHIRNGQVFDELFLMSIATLGAFAIGEFEEALGVMVFYKVGEMLQEGAQVRSRASIRALLDMRPETVRVRSVAAGTAGWREIDPSLAGTDAEYMALHGERLGLDGVIIQGETWLDTSAITGEPEPRRGLPGTEVLAGFIVLEGSVVVRATKPASESQVARILRMVEDATEKKARIEGMVSRFAAVYTPIVVALAAGIAFLPPLLVPGQSLGVWLYRALVMLVISCPCALVVSVPLGYFGGLGGAARRGILLKGSSVMDALAGAKTVVFDKTGTLTEGRFRVQALHPAPGVAEEGLLRVAASAEAFSSHPLAAAVRTEAASRGLDGLDELDVLGGLDGTEAVPEQDRREISGEGVIAGNLAAGNARLMARIGVSLPAAARALAKDSGELFVAKDGAYLGAIHVGDAMKPDAADAIRSLRELGVRTIVMLTGDAEAPARRAAAQAGVDEVHAGLLPEDKLAVLEKIITGRNNGGTTIFVGDGVNDAPVLARADVGIAMGSGADAAVESADAVLLTGEPSRVAEAIRRSRATRTIVVQNIVGALAFKAVVLALGAAGAANMWAAVVADVGVALLAVANSLRALR